MRVLRAVVSVFALMAAAFAAELKVRVVDAQSAAVAEAQVSLYQNASAAPVRVGTTAGDGTVSFSGLPGGAYQLQVLAPGFAAQTVDAGSDMVTVMLHVAVVTETVSVTATRTPLPVA